MDGTVRQYRNMYSFSLLLTDYSSNLGPHYLKYRRPKNLSSDISRKVEVNIRIGYDRTQSELGWRTRDMICQGNGSHRLAKKVPSIDSQDEDCVLECISRFFTECLDIYPANRKAGRRKDCIGSDQPVS